MLLHHVELHDLFLQLFVNLLFLSLYKTANPWGAKWQNLNKKSCDCGDLSLSSEHIAETVRDASIIIQGSLKWTFDAVSKLFLAVENSWWNKHACDHIRARLLCYDSVCFLLNATVWFFPPRDFVIQPELLKLRYKVSPRLTSSPASMALSGAGALCYSRFQWFKPNHSSSWPHAHEPQQVSFDGAKRFWTWPFRAPSNMRIFDNICMLRYLVGRKTILYIIYIYNTGCNGVSANFMSCLLSCGSELWGLHGDCLWVCLLTVRGTRPVDKGWETWQKHEMERRCNFTGILRKNVGLLW